MYPFAPLLVPFGSGAPFTPSDAPGGAFWYDSENTTLDITNTYVDSLIDRFAVAGAGLPASDPQRGVVVFGDPAYNGNPSVTWSNADDTQYNSPIILGVGPYTIYQVFMMSSATTYALALSWGDYIYNSVGFSLYTAQHGDGTGYLGQDASSGWLTSAVPILMTRRFNGTFATSTVQINGVDVPLTDGGGTGEPGLTPPVSTWVTLLNYWSGGVGQAADGSWATTAFYTEAHSDSVRTKVNAYFMNKYAI